MPCLPYVAKNVTGEAPGAPIPDACCVGAKTDPEGYVKVVSAAVLGQADTECLCDIGELILYTDETKLFQAIFQAIDQCSGTNQAAGYPAGATRVVLNSYFAPSCPQLAAKLNSTSGANTTIGSGNDLATISAPPSDGGIAPAPAESSAFSLRGSSLSFVKLLSYVFLASNSITKIIFHV